MIIYHTIAQSPITRPSSDSSNAYSILALNKVQRGHCLRDPFRVQPLTSTDLLPIFINVSLYSQKSTPINISSQYLL